MPWQNMIKRFAVYNNVTRKWSNGPCILLSWRARRQFVSKDKRNLGQILHNWSLPGPQPSTNNSRSLITFWKLNALPLLAYDCKLIMPHSTHKPINWITEPKHSPRVQAMLQESLQGRFVNERSSSFGPFSWAQSFHQHFKLLLRFVLSKEHGSHSWVSSMTSIS